MPSKKLWITPPAPVYWYRYSFLLLAQTPRPCYVLAMDISEYIRTGRAYIEKKFDEYYVRDSITNEAIYVYAITNRAMIPFDKVEDPATKKITWINPATQAISPVIEASGVSFSLDIVSLLLERIVNGEAITRICRDPSMPRYSQLVRWMRVHPWIKEAIEEARVARAEHHRDRVLEEAEYAESTKDPIEATKIKIEANKWAAGVDDARYKGNAKIEANISVPTQIIVNTGISRE